MPSDDLDAWRTLHTRLSQLTERLAVLETKMSSVVASRTTAWRGVVGSLTTACGAVLGAVLLRSLGL